MKILIISCTTHGLPNYPIGQRDIVETGVTIVEATRTIYSCAGCIDTWTNHGVCERHLDYFCGHSQC